MRRVLTRALRGRHGVPCRRHPRLFLAAALIPLLNATGAFAAAQEPPEFAVTTELVQIDVVVVDDKGRPVTELSAEDFEVVEGGEPQAISSFEVVVVEGPIVPASDPGVSAPQPFRREEGRYLILFLDDHHLGQVSVEQMRAAIGPFLAETLGDSDRVTLIAPENGVYWTSRSAEQHRRLPEVLARLKGWGGSPFGTAIGHSVASPSVRPYDAPLMSPAPSPVEAGHMARLGVIDSLSGVLDVLERLAGVPGRKSLLLYSEGFPHIRGQGEFDRVIDLARRSNVVVEFVDARGLTIHPVRSTGGPGYLAWATGGRTTVSNDYTEAVQAVLRESSAYYLLGYEPPAGERSERRVEVRVRRPGLEVRSRRRYYLNATEAVPVDRNLTPQVRVVRSLSDATQVGFEVRTSFSEPNAQGRAATTLAIEIRRPSTPRERRLRLFAEALPLNGADPFHYSAELAIPLTMGAVQVTRDWDLAPGVWQARIALEDVETGEVGSLLHTFEVPDGP